LRRIEPDEDPNRTRLRRDTTSYKCSRSGATSHNTMRCTLQPPIVPEEVNEEVSGAVEGAMRLQLLEFKLGK